MPLSPTAKHVLGRAQATPYRTVAVRLSWRRQVLPSSVLRRIVPSTPTTTQVLERGQATPFRVLVVPLGWRRAVGAAGRSDKRPPSGRATSTSGSSTDSHRSRDSPQNIAAPPSFLFPAPQTQKPTRASVISATSLRWTGVTSVMAHS